MSLAKFSVRNSLFVNLLSIFLVLAGLVVMLGMRREAFPNVAFDKVIITTKYFGATPQEIEKLVTFPIEEELEDVDDIDEMNSVSAEGISVIVIDIDPDAPNKDRVVTNIQRAVDRARDLPEDADDPFVDELESRDRPVIEVSLAGDMSERELRQYAKALETRLLDIPNVASIARKGWRDREMWVEIDAHKLADYHVSLTEIITALAHKNVNLPGGTMTTASEDFLVRTVGEFETAPEIARVIIRGNDRGNWIRIEDVGQVVDAFEDDELIEKTRGKRAINLVVIKREQGDTITIVKQVEHIARAFALQAGDELEISFLNDISYYIKRRLRILLTNGWIGMLLVTTALLLFLSRSAALMTVIGIPVAIFTTIFLMNIFGLTINLITMFALIMVLGLVVDDAIIIAENIYRYIERGLAPQEAAVRGAEEVTKPVVATVLTTIAAFMPIFFMSGRIGKFTQAIPQVVILALAASLFEALVILPSHMADFARPSLRKPARLNAAPGKRGWYKRLLQSYTDVLTAIIRHRYKAAGVITCTFVGAIALWHFGMKFVLFPRGMIEQFYIRAEAPLGTPLEETATRIAQFERLLDALPAAELDNYVTQVGIIQEDHGDAVTSRGAHLGQIHVYLTPETKRKRKASAIIDELRRQSADSEGFERFYFEMERPGPPVGKAVEIQITGDDRHTLVQIADQFKAFLQDIEGTVDVRDDLLGGKTELKVIVNEEAAARALLSVRDVALAVKYAFDGGVATTIKTTDEEIDVIVRFPERDRVSLDTFDQLLVPNHFGDLVPLKRVARIERAQGLSVINHLDRQRVVKVTSDVNEQVVTPIEIQQRADAFYKQQVAPLYPDDIVTFGGEQEETQKSLRDLLQAFGLGFFLIFMILASSFGSLVQPFVVMLAIPFGLVGVIVTFFLHGQPLSFMSLLGVIGLTGVVVNDSIVLVNFINIARREGASRLRSIIQAGRTRLRPVILTTITTLGGLTPIAYGIGGSDPFLKPMALAISWGLLFATALTLLIVPCAYAILDDIAHWVSTRTPLWSRALAK